MRIKLHSTASGTEIFRQVDGQHNTAIVNFPVVYLVIATVMDFAVIVLAVDAMIIAGCVVGTASTGVFTPPAMIVTGRVVGAATLIMLATMVVAAVVAIMSAIVAATSVTTSAVIAATPAIVAATG